jgi:hypothetical protein
MKTILIAAISSLFVAAPAFAAQPGSPTIYNGTYQLSCENAELVLHLDIGATVAGVSRSFSGNFVAPLDCGGVDQEEIIRFEEDLFEQCVSGGLTKEMCYPLSQDIAAAVSEFNNDALGFIPVKVRMTVQSVYSFWNQVFGIYPMSGQHFLADGSSSYLSYVLNNNTGSELGKFGVFGVQLFNGATSGQLGCADVAVGGVEGRMDRLSGLLRANYAVDRSLYCAAFDGVNAFGGAVGLSFRGQVSGQK